MYYEARQHTSVPVADAAAAVRMVHSGHIMGFQCPTWKNKAGQRIALVDDGHIDDSWGEVAVINLDTRKQLESITFGLCEDEAEKLKYVLECENGPALSTRKVTLSIDGSGEDQPAAFTCSCCGESFHSTIREQKPYDQDAGYGLCPKHVRPL